MYTLLPEQYAFLPGAMVVTPLGTGMAPGEKLVTSDGSSVVAGYVTYMGTNIRPPQMTAYEIRPATEVLKQGYFNMSHYDAGDAGTVTLQGNTTILDGAIGQAL